VEAALAEELRPLVDRVVIHLLQVAVADLEHPSPRLMVPLLPFEQMAQSAVVAAVLMRRLGEAGRPPSPQELAELAWALELGCHRMGAAYLRAGEERDRVVVAMLAMVREVMAVLDQGREVLT
jgi:hypothetical protein